MVIQAELVFLQIFFSAHATRQKEEKWIVNFLEPVEQSSMTGLVTSRYSMPKCVLLQFTTSRCDDIFHHTTQRARSKTGKNAPLGGNSSPSTVVSSSCVPQFGETAE